MVGTLMKFYIATPINKFLMVGLFWLIWPGLMFLVGLVGESRLVPVWKHQSKVFIPGELFFGVAVVAEVGMHKIEMAFSQPIHVFIWVIIAIEVIFQLFPALRERDVVNYPPRSIMSPTKITHDIVGYILIPIAMIGLGVPYIPLIFVRDNWMNWIVFLVSMVGYFVCVAIDCKNGFTLEDTQARHPSDWRPIWETLMRKRRGP